MYETISQSERYVESAQSRETDFPKALARGIPARYVGTVLDVGCGERTVTKFLADRLQASVIGVEPSKKVVDALNLKWQAFQNLSFIEGSAWGLPFKSREFDLVVAKGILPWVEPQFLLGALAELARVSDRYILLWDKFASEDFKTPYVHSKGAFTYRRNVLPYFMLTGEWNLLRQDFWAMREKQFFEVAEADFRPLRGNPLSWDGHRRVVLARTFSDPYPTLNRTDFNA